MADPQQDHPRKPPSPAVMVGVAVTGIVGVLVTWFVMFPGPSGSAAPKPQIGHEGHNHGAAPPPAPIQSYAGSAFVGKKAPDFTLPQVGGSAVRLSAQRGKEIVLIFYRTHT